MKLWSLSIALIIGSSVLVVNADAGSGVGHANSYGHQRVYGKHGTYQHARHVKAAHAHGARYTPSAHQRGMLGVHQYQPQQRYHARENDNRHFRHIHSRHGKSHGRSYYAQHHRIRDNDDSGTTEEPASPDNSGTTDATNTTASAGGTDSSGSTDSSENKDSTVSKLENAGNKIGQAASKLGDQMKQGWKSISDWFNGN